MSKLYSSPLRVYLLLGALALIGVYSGFHLPISLFPNSSKPRIGVRIPYGNQTGEEFLNTYGRRLEDQLRAISTEKIEVERMEASYDSHTVTYTVEFKWGVSPTAALKEVQTVVNAFASRLSDESRDSTDVWLRNDNSGFIALSFFSDTRSLDDLYDLLEPLLTPKVAKVKDAQDPELWNPARREVRIELNQEVTASLQLFPRDIESAVASSLGGRTGGSVTVGTNLLQIEMPRRIVAVPDLGKIAIPTPSGRSVHLSEIAHVELGPKTMDSRSFKTNGAPSLILFASPKPGGNVKSMSEEILQIVDQLMPTLPRDVQYRVLVDPSEFIRSAVNNVFHEVFIAAMLAVAVLFLFIGSFRNVVTAAIEIPLSMVLAFILMRLSGMNLNLISLGGLALSAGMNVDASVVVMENIFRHFEMHKGPHDFAARLQIVLTAVKEVQFAVIASTISSLVVFLPLTFTSDLSHAILGDLALAVVFSHGFSAFVALLLVPTVRLHLMAKGTEKAHHSPIEKQLKWLEEAYARLLGRFLQRPRLKWTLYAGLSVVLVALGFVVLPRLPREVVGKPDTDWMLLGVSTQGNTLLKQMELQAEEVERELLTAFGAHVQYTFNQVVSPNDAWIMARLKDKKEMHEIWKAMEKRFANTPFLRFEVNPWNPSELPIPNPPDLLLAVRGTEVQERREVAKSLEDLLEEKKVFPRVFTTPEARLERGIFIEPHFDQWTALQNQGARLSPDDLADVIRVATNGRRIGYYPSKNRLTEVILRYPHGVVSSVEDIGAFPVGVGSKLIPLKALANIRLHEADPTIFREDTRELFYVKARHDNDTPSAEKNKAAMLADRLVRDWQAKDTAAANGRPRPTVTFEDAAKDLTEAIHQLAFAVALSILLIFLTLLIQFGSFVEPLLVLVSIPLGFIGVLVSLFVFQSTLSLNSILGVILLNGIAVANSIILVDFIKRLSEEGLPPVQAAVDAARKRLRPILITSLCTVLGMLPIALGLGEGGRILQPLGIAVSGGLWVSMGLTLFLVPSLQVSYLQWRSSRQSATLWNLDRFRRLSQWRLAFRSLFLLALLLPASARGQSPAEPLSFDEALKAIVARSLGVGTSRENLEVTRALNIPSHLGLLPALAVTGSQNTQSVSDITSTRKGVQATLDLNLFHFGADVAGMIAANAEERSGADLVELATLQAEDDGVRALLAFIEAKKEVAVLRQIWQIRADSRRIARERYDKGLMAAQEVDKLSVDMGNDESRLRDAELQAFNAEGTLAALLGSVQVRIEWPWAETLPRAAERLTGNTPPSLSSRPDWKAAEKKIEGSQERMKQAWGKIFPSLDLNFSYGYFQSDSNSAFFTPTPPGVAWSGTATLTIPLFDRLTNYSQYESLVHQKALAELDLEKIKRNALSEWKAARDSLGVALQTAKAREETLAVSRKLYQDNLLRFRRGLVDANDLSVDQERSYNAELFAIRGWSSVNLGFARLCHALGFPVSRCLDRL